MIQGQLELFGFLLQIPIVFFDRTIRKVRNWNQSWALIDGSPCICCGKKSTMKWLQSLICTKVNRDRYNIDAPGCKKKAYMGLDFRTLNGSEI